MRSKKRWPGAPELAPRAVSRRSETVTMAAPAALTASLITCGEGKRAVPSKSREGTVTP